MFSIIIAGHLHCSIAITGSSTPWLLGSAASIGCIFVEPGHQVALSYAMHITSYVSHITKGPTGNLGAVLGVRAGLNLEAPECDDDVGSASRRGHRRAI